MITSILLVCILLYGFGLGVSMAITIALNDGGKRLLILLMSGILIALIVFGLLSI